VPVTTGAVMPKKEEAGSTWSSGSSSAWSASGALWARAVGITLAVLSSIANFLFIPYYPFWSLLIIALDVFAIWALASFSREAAI
jgi:hypothetical protein